jgi:hypothetical protein
MRLFRDWRKPCVVLVSQAAVDQVKLRDFDFCSDEKPQYRV